MLSVVCRLLPSLLASIILWSTMMIACLRPLFFFWPLPLWSMFRCCCDRSPTVIILILPVYVPPPVITPNFTVNVNSPGPVRESSQKNSRDWISPSIICECTMLIETLDRQLTCEILLARSISAVDCNMQNWWVVCNYSMHGQINQRSNSCVEGKIVVVVVVRACYKTKGVVQILAEQQPIGRIAAYI